MVLVMMLMNDGDDDGDDDSDDDVDGDDGGNDDELMTMVIMMIWFPQQTPQIWLDCLNEKTCLKQCFAAQNSYDFLGFCFSEQTMMMMMLIIMMMMMLIMVAMILMMTMIHNNWALCN